MQREVRNPPPHVSNIKSSHVHTLGAHEISSNTWPGCGVNNEREWLNWACTQICHVSISQAQFRQAYREHGLQALSSLQHGIPLNDVAPVALSENFISPELCTYCFEIRYWMAPNFFLPSPKYQLVLSLANNLMGLKRIRNRSFCCRTNKHGLVDS